MNLIGRSINSARLAVRIRRERKVPYQTPERIERLQRRRVSAIARHAFRSVPFYAEAMRALGLRPEELRRAEDLARLPLLDGVTVRRDVERFTSRAVAERVAMRSSGSGLTHVRSVVWWDASSQLADGSQVDGVVALRKALLARPEVIVGTITEKLLIYALGRGLTPADMPAVRAIVRQAGANGYKFSAIVLGITNSTPFQMRTKPSQEAVQTARR